MDRLTGNHQKLFSLQYRVVNNYRNSDKMGEIHCCPATDNRLRRKTRWESCTSREHVEDSVSRQSKDNELSISTKSYEKWNNLFKKLLILTLITTFTILSNSFTSSLQVNAFPASDCDWVGR